ncbi:MAG: DUF4272 domain-containing protein [Lachnospiraceae bacterium]|nr:DUF4272 domain-containing protein [Lachnospiraceae bacterium]
MEVNQIFNRQLKEALGNEAIRVLMMNNLMTQDDFRTLGITWGYVYTRDDGQIEAAFKMTFSDKEHFFAAQNGKLMLVNINDLLFEQAVNFTKQNHPCLLNAELPETKLQRKRREKNNKICRKRKIAAADMLMTCWNDDAVTLRDKETICRRAIACLICTQIACDIGKNNYQASVEYFVPMLKQYGVEDLLNSKEKKLVDGTYTMQDAIDMDWAYEAYWALCWSLGLVKDISDAGDICDCQKAIGFVMDSGSTDNFIRKCKLRSKEDILDMLDLYFRYNWAINDKKVHPESPTGNLHPSVVIERRRGLEWLVTGDVDDWYDLSMNA